MSQKEIRVRGYKRIREDLRAGIEDVNNQLALLHPDHDEQVHLRRTLKRLEIALASLESDAFVVRARRLAIDIPTAKEKPSWWASNYEEGMPLEAEQEWLTPTGRVGVAKLIREERRKNVEWWVKIIPPLLAALISLLGLVVALVSVSRK